MMSNNERIRGLASLLRKHTAGSGKFNGLASSLEEMFDEVAWRCEVFQPLQANASRLANWIGKHFIKKWAAMTVARDTLVSLLPSPRQYSYLGAGSEGVVFHDGDAQVLKVFQDAPEISINLLCEKQILGCMRLTEKVISYSFVKGASFSGGHGPALIEMLRRLKDRGCVMTNIKPENLVVAEDGSIEIVDLGRDWTSLTPALWKSMCRRAFLSWRFANHPNLQQLMRRERNGEFFPELTGVDNFFKIATHGFSPFVDPERFEERFEKRFEKPQLHGSIMSNTHRQAA